MDLMQILRAAGGPRGDPFKCAGAASNDATPMYAYSGPNAPAIPIQVRHPHGPLGALKDFGCCGTKALFQVDARLMRGSCRLPQCAHAP